MSQKTCFFTLFLCLSGFFFSVSCKKDKILTDPSARLLFSRDTVLFDTVFTTIGSVTRQLKVYNPAKRPVIISEIAVAKGAQSLFRINVDGIPGPVVKDIEILPEDSIYIFVEVTVDPQNSNTPMVVQDSLLFSLNGNLQDVDLVAWGQDVFYINSIAVCTQTWTKEKPFLIYNSMLVDSNCTLTIEAGTQLYFHAGSALIVHGTLKINGTDDEPVVLQGDRLEPYYDEVPGQWFGIWLRGNAMSRDNEFNYAVIKNATIGIQADTVFNNNPTVRLQNTIVKNMSAAGIFSQGAHIEATNTVVANCGQYAAALTLGGKYDFVHCTFANYWNYGGNRKTPAVFLNNYYEDANKQIQLRPLEKADFTNCIIYGNIDNEFGVDAKPEAALNYALNYTLVRSTATLNGTNIYYNENPDFVDFSKLDFHLKENSFARDKGTVTPVATDIEGKPRNGAPDLGAYEY